MHSPTRRIHFLMATLLALLVVCSVASCQTTPVAKNVIIMIRDGGGFNHAQAASLYRTGQFDQEIWQQFPIRLAASTFPAGGSYDPQRIWQGFDYAKTGATDSAASATALATGVKTKNGAIGVDAQGQRVENMVEAAEKLGKSTGLLSSVPFSHATPAGFGSHDNSRGEYHTLARQMVDESGIDVILSAGNPGFDDSGKALATPKYGFLSEATWQALQCGKAGGDANGDGKPDAWKLIQTREEFQALLKGRVPKRVFGLAQVASTLQEGRQSPADNPPKTALPFSVPCNANVPTLAEMTGGALRVLGQNPKGFFMMVEGGAVDWAAHSNFSGRTIEEEFAFSEAVAEVVKWVEANSNWNETLLIVTADHETGCLTGPDSVTEWKPLVSNGAGKLPGMEWHYGSHTNSLVPVYAKGAGSKLLRDLADQRDPVRGRYVDNIEINQVMRAVLK